MNAIALAGPAVEPVSLAEMKVHLRIDGAAEDALVASLVTAARATIEGATRLALVAQTWRVTLPGLPAAGRIPLPLWPILSVEAVRFVGDSGTTLLATGDYRIERNGDPVVLVVTAAPPATPAAVTIDLTAGFGTAAADPAVTLRLAIQRLAARWWAERGAGIRPSAGPLDPDIAALVSPFCRPRLA